MSDLLKLPNQVELMSDEEFTAWLKNQGWMPPTLAKLMGERIRFWRARALACEKELEKSEVQASDSKIFSEDA